jgi:hypothetical protein
MSSINSAWVYTTIPSSANGGTKIFNRIIVSRTDSARFYEKRGEQAFLLLPVGAMIPYAGTEVPGGYLPCDGSEVLRNAFPDLFEAIGTRYGEGDGSTTFRLPLIAGPSSRSGVPLTVGEEVEKDMSTTGVPNLYSQFAPDGVYYDGGGTSASYWEDWGDDIFDDWGYFYLYDPGSQSYMFLTLDQTNLADGVMATQQVSAFERSFTIVHGYCAQGVYRFEITCTSDSNPFRFGAYGDMGSDGSTINTNVTSTITVGGTPYTMTYNRNVEEGDLIERFFAYFVPFNPNEFANKTYTENVDGDQLYYYSNAVTNGLTVYFSKRNDVVALVEQDLRILSGKIRGGGVTVDESGVPVNLISTSYIVKC